MPVKESPSGQYVQYTGDADERVISKSDWKSADITHDEIRWDASNLKHVPIEDISEEAWAYIDADDAMKLVTVEDVSSLRAGVRRSGAGRPHPLAGKTVAEANSGEANPGPSGGTAAGGGGTATTVGGSTGAGTTATGGATTTGGSTRGGRGSRA